MKKYKAVFAISLQQEFAYRVNFFMWRVRNILQLLMVFFLWDSVFSVPGKEVFGYDRAKILTYIFGVFLLKALVISSRAQEIAGEIARGDLTNYLLKPLNYFSYWLTRDLSSKALNMFFVFFELLILYFLLNPILVLPSSVITFLMFLFSLVLGLILYFLLLSIFASFPFWFPEQAWGMIFLLSIFTDLLGGLIFPLDILPSLVQKIIYLTPFPYLVFIPLQIYLDKVTLVVTIQSIVISLIWVMVLLVLLQKMWFKGLKTYRGEGR